MPWLCAAGILLFLEEGESSCSKTIYLGMQQFAAAWDIFMLPCDVAEKTVLNMWMWSDLFVHANSRPMYQYTPNKTHCKQKTFYFFCKQTATINTTLSFSLEMMGSYVVNLVGKAQVGLGCLPSDQMEKQAKYRM